MNLKALFTATILIIQGITVVSQTAKFNYFNYQGNDTRFNTKIDWSTQYYNPIISGFYPDPSICRKGDTYYLVNSSFSYFPGIPIFTSTDLVHWEQIGHVLDRPSQLKLDGQGMSGGIFAPAITYNQFNETFYLITTNVGMGNFFVKTKDPSKGWSDPILLPEVHGIDPSFYFESAEKGYIVNNDAPNGGPDWEQQRSIWIHEFDVLNDLTIGKTKEIVRGGTNIERKPIWIEGPHLYKIQGTYYLMCAEGGTDTDHSEVVFRSNNPWGPYESYAKNPILTQRDLPENRTDKITCTGHADMIDTPEGEWWAVFLACRPYEDNYLNTGRETFLLPVTWQDGFPTILPQGKPIPSVLNKKNLSSEASKTSGNFTYRNDFNANKLDYSWIYLRTPDETNISCSDGYLNIKPLPVNIDEKKNLTAVFYRQQHTCFEVSTELTFEPKTENDFAGLVLIQNEDFHFTFGKTIINGDLSLVICRKEKNKETLNIQSINNFPNNKPIFLKIISYGRYYGFLYSDNGNNWTTLVPKADGVNLSTRKAGGFLGTCIGLYATSNY